MIRRMLILACLAGGTCFAVGKCAEIIWQPRLTFDFSGLSSSQAAQSKRAYEMLTGAGPVGSHRGGQRCWPENTLTAFHQTNKRWKKMLIETDVMATADGKLVLSHDFMITRVSNGHGSITAQTLEQLKKYDFGYNFKSSGEQDYPWRGKGVKICTLGEALTQLPDAVFEIEIKGGPVLAKKTVKVIQQHKAVDRVILASFHPMVPPLVKKIEPDIVCCYGFVGGLKMLKAIRSEDWRKYQPEFEILSLTQQFFKTYKISQQDISRMHARGIWLQIHTVDSPQRMKKYLDLGFDSVLTDRPDELMKYIKIK